MKNILKISTAIVIISLLSCEKNLIEQNQLWQYVDPNSANIKVVNAYTSNIPVGAPGVGVTRFYIYQDGAKLNGNAISTAGSWPGSATYASVKPGNSGFTMILDRRIGTDYGKVAKGDTAFNSKFVMDPSKFYSLFMIGEAPTQTTFLVNDNLKDPQENKYAIRFANLVVSASPKPVDIYSRRGKKNLASNLSYKSITDFVEIPIPTRISDDGKSLVSISDTIDVREAGKTVNLYSLNNFNPTSRRIYTFYNYGRVAGGTAFAERLTSYTNR